MWEKISGKGIAQYDLPYKYKKVLYLSKPCICCECNVEGIIVSEFGIRFCNYFNSNSDVSVIHAVYLTENIIFITKNMEENNGI